MVKIPASNGGSDAIYDNFTYRIYIKKLLWYLHLLLLTKIKIS
jgi:hypothetical protein